MIEYIPFLKITHKQNRNERSFDWYNYLFFMKTGCEIKMIETKIDVIWKSDFTEKHNSTMKKNRVLVWYRNTMDKSLLVRYVYRFFWGGGGYWSEVPQKFNKHVGHFACSGKLKSRVQLHWRPESAMAITSEVQNYGVKLLCQTTPKCN